MTAVIEDAKAITVDKWGSLNTATSPVKLPEGHSPNLNNVWTDEKPGAIVTANGYQFLGRLPSDLPPTLMINYYKSSDGTSMLIVSDGQNVYKTTDFTTFTSIKTGLSEFFQLRGAVVRDKVWLTNGVDSVMTYDGTTLTTLDGTGGTPNVPKGKYIAYHDERVWMFGISGDVSSARFSELSDTAGTEIAPDNSAAWPTDNEIKISDGDADIGTALFLYRGYLYASKQYSIWRIVGYDKYSYSRVKTRASTGTRFAESIREKDNMVEFIGVDGLYVFNGEETKRISDILDPASSEEGVFAFRNLQQQLLNNNFWQISSTSDFNAGTVPAIFDAASDRLLLKPADDTSADWAAGTRTNLSYTDNPGAIQLSIVATGGGTTLLSTGKTASLVDSNGMPRIGSASQITDGTDSGQKAGFKSNSSVNILTWVVDLGATYPIGYVSIPGFYYDNDGQAIQSQSAKIQGSSDGTNWSDISSITMPTAAYNASRTTIFQPLAHGGYFAEGDISATFSTVSYRYVRLLITAAAGVWAIAELKVYQSGYESSGKFVSKTIDYGGVPHSFGALAGQITTNGQNYQFFTQSSNDGSTWDAEVNVSNNAAIGSTLRRYLRWGVYLYSSTGLYTPVVESVYVGGTYISQVHDAGASINQWGAFQADQFNSGQTINFYYRGASTSGAVAAQPWTQIYPGSIPALATTDRFVQIRVFMSTSDATKAPYLNSFTVNWVVGTGLGINTLQNVASIVILNRYWLAAATLGATENDIVIVHGKETFDGPFTKKDFKFLSFCRFQDYFIGGSSEDGALYRLEVGYSKNGESMDSYFESADFSDGGFTLNILQTEIGLDRTGPFDLSLGISKDGGLTYTEKTIDLTRATGQKLSTTIKNHWNIKTDTFRIRVRINGADQPFSVDTVKVLYRVMTTRGSLN